MGKKRVSHLAAGMALLWLLTSCGPTAPLEPSESPGQEVEQLHLTQDQFPRLDGSLSMAPLARAASAVLLEEERNRVEDLIHFSGTTAAYRAMMAGEADLLMAAEPGGAVEREGKERGFSWEKAPIAIDALVFVVQEENPVENLTTEQIRQIYMGEITNWKEVGGEDCAISPLQQSEETASQALMRKLVMGNLPLMKPPNEERLHHMAGMVEGGTDFHDFSGALGYTIYHHEDGMRMRDGGKLISVDGVFPSPDTIRSGQYPFSHLYYGVIRADAEAASPERRMFEWLQSPLGQSLIQYEGYLSVLEDPVPVDWSLGEAEPLAEQYTRRFPEKNRHLIPSSDYGALLPFMGGRGVDGWMTYERYGLVTPQGEIIVDPVYSDVWQLRDYNGTEELRLPVFVLEQMIPGTGGTRERRCALAAADGSWVTGFDFRSLQVVGEKRIWAIALNGDGVMLDERGRELWRLPEKDKTGESASWEDMLLWNDEIGVFLESGNEKIILMDGTVHEKKDSWEWCGSFFEGLSAAHDPISGNWGYIGTDGRWAIPPAYAECDVFRRGKAIVRLPNGAVQVLDQTGTVLWERTEGRLEVMEGEDFFYYCWFEPWSDSRRNILGLYGEDLKEIPSEAKGLLLYSTDGWLWKKNAKDGIDLYSSAGTLHLEGRGDFMGQEGDFLKLRFWDKKMEQSIWRVYHTDGTLVMGPKETDFIWVWIDPVNQRRYLFARTGERDEIYDVDGNFLTQTRGPLGLYNGLVASQTELSFGYQDLEGNWVFRITIQQLSEHGQEE